MEKRSREPISRMTFIAYTLDEQETEMTQEKP
jgi:hypothetical protein